MRTHAYPFSEYLPVQQSPASEHALDEESELWRRIEPSKAHSRSAPRHSDK